MAKCKGCGDPIRWGKLFGKPHPFNRDGSSHFDSCPQAAQFRGGLRTLGDRDTHYRQAWRQSHTDAIVEMDVSRLSQIAVPVKEAREVAARLTAVGGPYSTWQSAELDDFFVGGGLDDTGVLVALFVREVLVLDLQNRLGWYESGCLSVGGYFLVPEPI